MVGGGITGIAAALELAKSGRFDVTLYEKEPQLGGLSASFSWENVTWDRYYHVLLSSDSTMLDLVKEIGLGEALFFRETKTGFYGGNRLVSMSSSLDFIKFPFMSPWQKLRMGLGILHAASIKNPAKLDGLYVREWLTRVFGRRVYERIWDPLLRSKLGEARERTSAAFIWATIGRLYGARDTPEKKERMGHVHGGYASILSSAEKRLGRLNIEIRKKNPVLRVECDSQGVRVESVNGRQYFDSVLLTVDTPTVIDLLGNPTGDPYWDRLRSVEYLGVACVLLVLRESLSPFYVINLLDKELPFTGIIEATNIVSPREVGGYHLVYLPRYHTAQDPVSGDSDAIVIARAIEGLRRVFPGFSKSSIAHSRLLRAPRVQPLQDINDLSRTISSRTPWPNVYLADTAMILNSTLNNNAAVTIARQAAAEMIAANADARTPA